MKKLVLDKNQLELVILGETFVEAKLVLAKARFRAGDSQPKRFHASCTTYATLFFWHIFSNLQRKVDGTYWWLDEHAQEVSTVYFTTPIHEDSLKPKS